MEGTLTTTEKINVDNSEQFIQLFGIREENMSLFHEELGVDIYAHGGEVTLTGDPQKVALAKLTLEKTGDSCKVTEYSLTPLVTHRAPNPSMSVYKLSDYTEELASQNAIRNAPGCGDFTLQYCYDLVGQILGEGFDANEGILKGTL